MCKTTKISIIIPVYHVEEYILMCLQSVVNQTMKEGIECILVDDCGGDKSIEIARQFIEEYNGNILFKIIYREHNGGLSAARNSGINVAQGDYIYFLDSDDEISPNCMELMYGLVEKFSPVDLVQGSFYESEEERKTMSPHKMREYTDNRRLIKSFLLKYEGDIVGAQSRLVNRRFLLDHNLLFKRGIIHEDNYWTFFLAKYVRNMAFCPVRTYYHRYNPMSITGNINVKNETIAYRIIVGDFSRNIDNFLPGHQKELILSNLLTAINCHYYKDRKEESALIDSFLSCNNWLERILFKLFFYIKGEKILHLLIRIYKLGD